MKANAYIWTSQKAESINTVAAQQSAVKTGLLASLQKMLLAFLSNVSSSPEPRIWQVSDRAGNVAWHVYDPVSSQTSSFGSEAEVRVWLDQRYYS